jgi:hypothetical protein
VKDMGEEKLVACLSIATLLYCEKKERWTRGDEGVSR